MKKIYLIPSLFGIAVLLQSGVKFSSIPPSGLTGASGTYCNSCHGGAAVNAGGGAITVNGLPSSGYVPGQSYPFSINITHGAANRTRWGFSITARNASGSAVGTFSSTNPNAAINSNTGVIDQELSHLNAVIQSTASNTFTYNNLVWTAPAIPPTGNTNVTFFYVGNAANGNFTTSGDFIYAGSTTLALPVELKNFSATVNNNNAVAIQWITATEANSDYFEVQKSDDNQFFYSIAKVNAAGNSSADRTYNYTDRTITSYNKPVSYRLKLMDKDGKFKLSKVVTVKLTGGKTLVENVYPTIVKANMLITAEILSDKEQPVKIQMVDVNGRLLKTVTDQLVAGSNTIGFRVPSTLPRQWIFAKITVGNVRQTVPLVVHP